MYIYIVYVRWIVVEVVIPALLCHIDILTPFFYPVTIPISKHDY